MQAAAEQWRWSVWPATAMLMLDIAVVNTALSRIARDLHSALNGLQWGRRAGQARRGVRNGRRGMAMSEQMAAAVDGHLALVTDALAPSDADNRYLNFVERPGDPARCFEPGVYQRLRQIKTSYDPNDLFRGNHSIPPTR